MEAAEQRADGARSTRLNTLMATAMLMALSGGPGAGVHAPSGPGVRSGNGHQPTPARRDTDLERQIADWNDAVERRKAQKMARRAGMKMAAGLPPVVTGARTC